MKISMYKAALLALGMSMLPAAALAAHWGYEGGESPEHWGDMDDAFKTCRAGMNQSPINIDVTFRAQVAPLVTHYTDGPITLLNNGHTIQAGMRPETQNSITLDNTTWTLQQFHFHAPSENTVHGKHYAMEMHLVHTNAEGEIAVVAVMFDKGPANPELDDLWQNMPAQAEQNAALKPDLDINKLLPTNKTYWRFSGSLTTPPCSEGVSWLVLKHPLTLSSAQLEKFTGTMHHDNNRPVQPLHGRVVVE
ncbi:carbonic anhydrase [Enterobacter sp. BIGb0383]|uniref:carbonic anhydrase n=1 Tax=unclassified Enterobacter TaxID=2608935 RepID=UPI000F497BB2|nr:MULTISPECIES: carbonic anhydrase family protein [unclassified Enterobacter]ROP57987.1 carbonic anhydrase [Enterobacter sp. BIGb0383]ROS00946.1 carbonic anhydrase [Enterobacter sp. BIGb0359]